MFVGWNTAFQVDGRGYKMESVETAHTFIFATNIKAEENQINTSNIKTFSSDAQLWEGHKMYSTDVCNHYTLHSRG